MTAVSKPEPTKNPRGYEAGIFFNGCRKKPSIKADAKGSIARHIKRFSAVL
jgi:hypothetical protein